MRNNIGNECVVDKMTRDLGLLLRDEKIYRKVAEGLDDETRLAISLLCASIRRFGLSFQDSKEQLRHASEKIIEDSTCLYTREDVNGLLKDSVARLQVENRIIREELNMHNRTLEERLTKVLDLIETKVDMIANSEGQKRKIKEKGLHGESHMRYISEIDTKELVESYKASGYTLSKELVEKYRSLTGITYQGLRNRLISAGVWRGSN